MCFALPTNVPIRIPLRAVHQNTALTPLRHYQCWVFQCKISFLKYMGQSFARFWYLQCQNQMDPSRCMDGVRHSCIYLSILNKFSIWIPYTNPTLTPTPILFPVLHFIALACMWSYRTCLGI